MFNPNSSFPPTPSFVPSTIPSVGSLANSGVHMSLQPINLKPNEMGPFQKLAMVNDSPTFNSEENIQSEQLLEKMLKSGYIVEHLVYDNNTYPIYFIARTRLGDRTFIRLDNQEYRMSFPQKLASTRDIQLQKKSSLTLVPQETKMGVLQCLNYDICATAFVCNDSICITRRQSPQNMDKYIEENFMIQTGEISFITGNIGSSIIAYPIVSLSEVLSEPIKTENKISEASSEISNLAFTRLHSYNDNFTDSINRLNLQKENLQKFATEAQQQLSNDIRELSSAYDKIKNISPDTLSDSNQVIYYQIQRNLTQRKELRTQILNSLSDAYSTSSMIPLISQELRNTVDPTLNLFKNIIN